MKKFPISLLCGLAAIIVTVLMYFIILGDIFAKTIYIITLACILLAEVAVTALAYLTKGSPRKVAAVFAASLAVPFSVILSVIYINAFPKNYGTYIAWYVIGLIVVGAIAAILFGFEGNRQKENIALQNAKNNVLNMRKLVKAIAVLPEASEYKTDLNELEEKLHFTNDAVVAEQDAEIYSMLIDLQKNIATEGYDVSGAIAKLKTTVDVRTVMTKTTV